MTARSRRWSRAGGAVTLVAATTFGLLSATPWLIPMGTSSLPRATDVFIPWAAGSAILGTGLLIAQSRRLLVVAATATFAAALFWLVQLTDMSHLFGSTLVFVTTLLLTTWAITLRAWLLPARAEDGDVEPLE
jgi:hypothetical protein